MFHECVCLSVCLSVVYFPCCLLAEVNRLATNSFHCDDDPPFHCDRKRVNIFHIAVKRVQTQSDMKAIPVLAPHDGGEITAGVEYVTKRNYVTVDIVCYGIGFSRSD